MVLQREAKQPQSCAPQQAPPTDAISSALASADANPCASTSRDHGRKTRPKDETTGEHFVCSVIDTVNSQNTVLLGHPSSDLEPTPKVISCRLNLLSIGVMFVLSRACGLRAVVQ